MPPGDSPDWRPAASLETLRLRARVLAGIRAFFARRDVLEVETPLLSAAANPDPHVESFSTRYVGPGAASGRTLYLHTSPEYPMKRLLAAGSGPIYQLCRVFRQGEAGRLHNPEFTMLEWYRPGFDHHALMDEVEALVRGAIKEWADARPALRLTYREAFLRYAGLDPHRASVSALAVCAHEHAVAGDLGDERDSWLDLLLTHVVEPALAREGLVFLYDYPASQAALARVRDGDPPVAERFELYCRGVELANGFHELKDAHEQRRRFEAERIRRRVVGLDRGPVDEHLLSALEHGLPDCAGVALGVDRLVMLAAGAADISGVLAFPLKRA